MYSFWGGGCYSKHRHFIKPERYTLLVSKKSEQGNVLEIVIIAVLALALIGVLVWRFVDSNKTSTDQTASQTTGQDDSSKQTASQKEAETVKLIDYALDSRVGIDVSFKYPEGWTVEDEGFKDDSYVDHSLLLKSPSKSIHVQYMASNIPTGWGGCGDNESEKITMFNVFDLPNWSTVKYVEMATPGTGGAVVGLIRASDISTISVGSSRCDIPHLGVVLGKLGAKGIFLVARVEGAGNSRLDTATFEDNAEYQAAKSILLSTTVK